MSKNEKDIKFVSPDDISFNPNNPRGLSYDDKNFIALEESIRQYGIMVPLIVFENDGKDKKYTLLDGERRLRAAQKVRREFVPIHILDFKRDRAEGLKRMFQIHMLRDQWEPMAQAQALKFYVDMIRKENKATTEQDLVKKIAEITKMDKKTIEDRLRLLRFDQETQTKVMENKIDDSYLVQIEQNFIEQIDKNMAPAFFKDNKKEIIRKKLIEKMEKGYLGTARAFFWVPGAIETCKKLNKIEVFASLAKKFVEDIEYTVEELKNDLTKKVNIPSLSSKITTRSLIKEVNKLSSQLSEYDISKETIAKNKEGIISSLKKLNVIISQILDNN